MALRASPVAPKFEVLDFGLSGNIVRIPMTMISIGNTGRVK